MSKLNAVKRARRSTQAGVAVLVGMSLLLAGCSSAEKDAAKNAATSATSAASSAAGKATAKAGSAASSASAQAAGKVSITHAFGTTEYPKNPERVLAIGRTAIDNLLTIGVKPTAIVVSDREMNQPWQEGKLDGVKIIKVASFKDFKPEEYAATHPDLIVGDAYRVKKDTYPKLSEIAPTLGPASSNPKAIGWKEQVENLGKIYGKEDAAQKAIAQDKERFDKARTDMPGLKGKTGFIAQYIPPSKQFGIVASPDIPANQFLYDLGMTVPEAIQKLPNQKAGRATVAAENINLLEGDFLLIGARGGAEGLETVPGFANLPEVKAGAYRIAPPTLLQAVNQPSALSRAYALKELTPQLKKAAGEE